MREAEPQAKSSVNSVQDKATTVRGLLDDLTKELEALERDQRNSKTPQSIQDSPDAAGPSSQSSGLISSDEWLQDLRLLQYYCSTGHLELCSAEEDAKIWRDEVPKLAYTNKPLMHGLLALSALLYAHANPDQRETYQIASTRHESMAISSFTEQLASIDEESCPAAFLLTTLIFGRKTFSISDQYRNGMPVTMSDVTQAFLLSQGMYGPRL
ncbi:hypothetical protein MPH_01917 [Macrophomina phaseolina MS6]|uniref:Transcription factor domain-containing protein n=1 Tax=Macrophomina phaseolina (strain MS6) TaxID=1126212 RepID=K2SVX3_MACPH|nr:hypothetical protein MPH_01917 [Macrophomina phaseolina MS6]